MPVNKYTKASVNYTDRGTMRERCGTCRHFEIKGPRQCEIVEGTISRQGWCKLWARKLSAA